MSITNLFLDIARTHDAIRASRWNRTTGAQTAQGCENKVVLGASWWGFTICSSREGPSGDQATPSRGLWKLAHFLSKASNPTKHALTKSLR